MIQSALLSTIEPGIFTVKIIRVLYFHVKNISSFTGSAV